MECSSRNKLSAMILVLVLLMGLAQARQTKENQQLVLNFPKTLGEIYGKAVEDSKKKVAQVKSSAEGIWKKLEDGIELAVLNAPQKSSHGDSKFTIVRIDPKKRKLKLLMASEIGGKTRTAPEWAKDHTLAVNAGMFEGNGVKATYYMRNYSHVNNPVIAGENAFLAFNPVDESVPPVQIIDRECQDLSKLKEKFHTVIQGIRMVDCKQRNKWSQQDKKWSIVVVAMDKQDRVLFIFARSPYRVHDFIKMLLQLPLDIYNMMYLEGGPEASLYLSAGGTLVKKFGSYETGFNENDDNDHFWAIPNVIGVTK